MYDYYLTREENKRYKASCLVDIPAIGQKSFYGKAKFIHYSNGFVGCLSYDTVVCVFHTGTGEFYKTWNDWSATTAKHISSFMHYYFMSGFNKKEWLALPCYYFDWLYRF